MEDNYSWMTNPSNLPPLKQQKEWGLLPSFKSSAWFPK